MLTRLSWVIVGLAVAGCGGAEAQTGGTDTELSVGPAPAAENVIKAQPETLNEFVTAGETFQFLRVPGESPTYLLGFEHSSTSEGLAETLLGEHPDLTLLEMFYALAPADATPHPDLVAFHAIQTKILGRTDTSVRRVDFNVNRVSARSAADCTNYIISLTPSGQTWQSDRLNAVSKPNGGDLGLLCPAWQGLAGCDHQSIGGTHIIAGCNEGPSETAFWWSYHRNSNAWVESTIHYETLAHKARGWLLPEHMTGFFTDVQVMGILSNDIHLSGESPPSYHVRAGYSD